MGKAAYNEKLKLRATFFNNLAVATLAAGYLVPYFASLPWLLETATEVPKPITSKWDALSTLLASPEAKIKLVVLVSGIIIASIVAAGLRILANHTLSKIAD
ncbi:hypothetical protein IVA95_27235 [Bradyrhizobium sp. 157]|uniref:hypothetical protein n=1 Tax=Bradyrhizobium sp. 157 TaxID=2782631 RepID=UPI001FF88A7F|nr:hypothetical protein [Bradyrhizobium sp. 157]MCK1641188.1 hypothetical protein [Bradyrhizobium sp. 157]